MEYLDSFDEQKFKIFKKFNNSEERKERHIDTFYIKGGEDKEEKERKKRENLKNMIQDTVNQVKQMEDYFKGGDIDE